MGQWLEHLLEQKAMDCGDSSASISQLEQVSPHAFPACNSHHGKSKVQAVSCTGQPSNLSYPPTSPAGRNISLKYTMKHLDKAVNKNPHLILEPEFLIPMILVPSYQFLENGSASHIG